ncbi:protein FAM228B [Aplysia californica]|uniref:Protein FAM228B n=1 Tax=Aplysia californica TaxID=6500 RepID=A0ABM0JCN6_APLCA|nr:protein FAM228B [Aplysia californica]
MTSMIYVKRQGGSVKIHDREVVENVLGDREKTKTQLDLKKSRRQPRKSDVRVSSAPDTASTSSADSKGLLNHSVRVQDWLNEKTIKELQERADHESHAAKRLYTPLLETEATFVKDVGEYLAHKDLVDLRKKEVLHKRWSDQVYEPIRRKILEAIDGTEWTHLDRRKREMHRQFLEHVNKRGFVFLEDDDREEYYAQALNDHRPAPIKIRTEALKDPLLTLGKQKSEEDRIVLRCMTGQRYTDNDLDQVRLPPLPLVPLGRHGVNSCKWLEMPLSNIESESRERSRRRMLGVSTKSQIDFGAWTAAGYDAKIAEQELQIPRKKMFAEQPPYGRPPAEIPKAPFIDPEDFADKIINTDPYPEHMATLKSEYEAMQAWYEHQQQQQQNMLDEQQQQQPMLAQA